MSTAAATIQNSATFDSITFYEIMGRFAHARSLLKVCHGSLNASESASVGDEVDVLAEAVEKFRSVYNELDMFAISLPQTEPQYRRATPPPA